MTTVHIRTIFQAKNRVRIRLNAGDKMIILAIPETLLIAALAAVLSFLIMFASSEHIVFGIVVWLSCIPLTVRLSSRWPFDYSGRYISDFTGNRIDGGDLTVVIRFIVGAVIGILLWFINYEMLILYNIQQGFTAKLVWNWIIIFLAMWMGIAGKRF